MSWSTNVTGYKTFLAAAAASAYRRVVLNSSGVMAVADNTVKGNGYYTQDVSQEGIDAGIGANVRLFSSPGTYQAILTGTTCTAGDIAYAAAAGLVASTGTVIVGQFTASFAGNGAVVELLNY